MSKECKLQWSDIPAIVSSPKAFSIYACIGVVATMVATAIATKRYCEQEAEKSPEEKNEETILDKVVNIGKHYILPITFAVATTGCIHECNIGWQEYNGVINDALVQTQNIAAIYRAQAPGIVAATVTSGFNKRPLDEGKEWFCIKDLGPYGDIRFQAYPIDVLSAKYRLNRNFILRETASVREFCTFLGEDAVKQIDEQGDYYGWLDEDFYAAGLKPWIDISVRHITDQKTGDPMNIITFDWGPRFTEDAQLLAYGYKWYPTE